MRLSKTHLLISDYIIANIFPFSCNTFTYFNFSTNYCLFWCYFNFLVKTFLRLSGKLSHALSTQIMFSEVLHHNVNKANKYIWQIITLRKQERKKPLHCSFLFYRHFFGGRLFLHGPRDWQSSLCLCAIPVTTTVTLCMSQTQNGWWYIGFWAN